MTKVSQGGNVRFLGVAAALKCLRWVSHVIPGASSRLPVFPLKGDIVEDSRQV
jgi:hypothetical protein